MISHDIHLIINLVKLKQFFFIKLVSHEKVERRVLLTYNKKDDNEDSESDDSVEELDSEEESDSEEELVCEEVEY